MVEIPAPTFTDMRVSSNRWGDYVEDPFNPERAFIPDAALAAAEATAWFTMALPDSWEVNEVNHDAIDIPRQSANVYSIMRMSFGHTLYLTSENPEERLAATNQHGTKYYYWETSGAARVFYVEVAVPCYKQEYLYRLCFITFPEDPYAEDPEDYFETHVQPVIDSIRVEVAR